MISPARSVAACAGEDSLAGSSGQRDQYIRRGWKYRDTYPGHPAFVQIFFETEGRNLVIAAGQQASVNVPVWKGPRGILNNAAVFAFYETKSRPSYEPRRPRFRDWVLTEAACVGGSQSDGGQDECFAKDGLRLQWLHFSIHVIENPNAILPAGSSCTL